MCGSLGGLESLHVQFVLDIWKYTLFVHVLKKKNVHLGMEAFLSRMICRISLQSHSVSIVLNKNASAHT